MHWLSNIVQGAQCMRGLSMWGREESDEPCLGKWGPFRILANGPAPALLYTPLDWWLSLKKMAQRRWRKTIEASEVARAAGKQTRPQQVICWTCEKSVSSFHAINLSSLPVWQGSQPATGQAPAVGQVVNGTRKQKKVATGTLIA